MCIVTIEMLKDLRGKKIKQSNRFLFAVYCYTVTAKRLFVWAGAPGEMQCDMFNSIRGVRASSAQAACKPAMKGLKPDPWTGPGFSQLFQIGLLYYPSCTQYQIVWKSKKIKRIPTALWDQIQLQRKWLVWPSVIHSTRVCGVISAPKPRALLAASRKCCLK